MLSVEDKQKGKAMDIKDDEIVVVYNRHKCVYEGPFGELAERTKQKVDDCVMLFHLGEFGKDWLAILDY